MHGSRKVSKKVYGFSLRLLRDEIASHAETTISTLFWFCVLLFNLVPRTSPLAFEMHREVPGTLGKAKIHPNIVDFGWMEKSTRWRTKLFLAMPLGSLSFCLRHHSPVPELSFLPVPYRAWTRVPIWGGKNGEFRDWTNVTRDLNAIWRT